MVYDGTLEAVSKVYNLYSSLQQQSDTLQDTSAKLVQN